jgi:uncharacterized protein
VSGARLAEEAATVAERVVQMANGSTEWMDGTGTPVVRPADGGRSERDARRGFRGPRIREGRMSERNDRPDVGGARGNAGRENGREGGREPMRGASQGEPPTGGRSGKSNRGFASMSPERQREIASKGGRAAHEKGTAHEWTADEARQAGRKGGEVVSRDRAHMAAIGREGGGARGGRRTPLSNQAIPDPNDSESSSATRGNFSAPSDAGDSTGAELDR